MYESFITNDAIKAGKVEKKVALFGAGKFGSRFIERHKGNVEVFCFIDNGAADGSKSMHEGMPVYSFNDFERVHKKKLPIIITALSYWKEIYDQLYDNGYIPGKDYFVWFGEYNITNITDFIEHNNVVWSGNVGCHKDNKIIVMMTGVMCAHQIFFSYYANILAKRYDAEIVAGLTKVASAVPFEKAVYKSFGVHEYLDKPLSYSQRKRADEIFVREYPKLITSDDWLAFTLDGINYGYEIYRNYLRNISAIYDRARYGKELARILKRAIEIHIRYGDYFNTHSVKAIILTDALYDEGILRLLAWKRGIAVYAADDGRIFRWYPNIPHVERYGHNYKKMFAAMPEDLQKKGIAWAKEHLDKRLQGDISDIPYMKGKGTFNKIKSTNVLKKSNKIKVVICPHALTDDPYQGGKFLFNDHWSWLCYLGDMSERTDYDWYLKEHPAADKYSYDIWDQFLKRYPKIIKLPLDTSPVQLKNEGMDFALTICGTIGHEYPALGIQVINAGPNPHDDFDFDWNPKTVEEYERLLLHLPKLKKKIEMNEIYQFYCMYFLYDLTDRRRPNDIFFDNNLYGADSPWPTETSQNKYGLMEGSKNTYYDKAYRWFIDEFSEEKHKKLIQAIEKTVYEIDNEGVKIRIDKKNSIL